MSALWPMLAVSLLAAAELPSGVERTLVPAQPALGAPFVYEVRITHADDERFDLQPLPSAPNDGSAALEYVGHERVREGRVTTFKLKFIALDLQPQQLPPLTFHASRGGSVRDIEVPALDVQAQGTLPPDAAEKGADLFDIKPPESVYVRSLRLIWALLGALAVGLFAWRALRWWRRRKKRPQAAAPSFPLEERTRLALAALAREQLPAKGRVQEYYFRLSDIVRGYVGERFNVDALESTTAELLTQLNAVAAATRSLTPLRAFFDEADLAKFARVEPAPERCVQSFRFAEQFVKETTPAPTPHVSGPPLPAP